MEQFLHVLHERATTLPATSTWLFDDAEKSITFFITTSPWIGTKASVTFHSFQKARVDDTEFDASTATLCLCYDECLRSAAKEQTLCLPSINIPHYTIVMLNSASPLLPAGVHVVLRIKRMNANARKASLWSGVLQKNQTKFASPDQPTVSRV